MIPQLASRSFAVEDLFAAPFQYVSPSFQRPFAWTVEEAERLLGDIQAACFGAPDDIYFLGAILLMRVPLATETARSAELTDAFAGPERIFEIIDGQQRIVTLVILLAVLRDLTGREPVGSAALARKLSVMVMVRDRSMARVQLRGPDRAFLNHCISDPGACLVPPLEEVASEPQRRILAIRDYFVSQLRPLDSVPLVQLATFVTENCTLVSVVTSTIDRAYQMFTVLNDTGKPLTRNDILKAELIGQTDPGGRALATKAWDDLEQVLGPGFEQLFSFVRTQSGRAGGQIVEAVRAQVAANHGGAGSFIFDTLVPAGHVVDVILRAAHVGAPESAAINTLLRYLSWLPGEEWVPPLMSYWLRHGNSAPALLAFLSALDRFAYGVRIQGLGADRRAQRMAAVNTMINSGAPSNGPWPPLMLNRDELRGIQFSLRDLHKRSPQVCRLVLLRLNEHCGGAPLLGPVAQTTEHILPLKVAATSQWRTDFPDADLRQRLATCLGNLTLVPSPINERAANHDFVRKSAIYFGAGGQPVSKLTSELRIVATWTPQQVEERRLRLTDGLNALWQFDLV